MTNDVFYKCEDINIIGLVEFSPDDTSKNLDDFEIVIKISTTANGPSLLAYTEADRGVQIKRLPNNWISIQISRELTSKLSVGMVIITAALKHKVTGNVSLKEMRTVELKETRIKKSEL